MFSLLKLFGNHEIDAWRDEYTLVAAATLNRVAGDLLESFEEDLKEASWKDGLLRPGGFIAERVTPTVNAVARPVIEAFLKRANGALLEIVEHQTTWQYEPQSGGQDQHANDGWQDVAVAAGPLAGGVAVAAALPAMAVTTSTAVFGLVTTTAISWPVVVGGGAIAGIGIATGLLNAGKLWDKTEARLRKKIREHVVSILLRGTEKHPAVLEQLRDVLAKTAERAKRSC
ncbi:hypothetical protein GGQ97_001551 [Sphingomonas kaistensis]|uniref:Uncharacterized protein n=1 Tax=Sphingomonas kaistensis TaxID=298708 RepID=A0A7X5Y5U8_9SPHN|nr:hypothetical protein [Sphingomonas kaistensis]NJC05758.1 hypothetical protein [Sphingomonas kaistensis]